MSYTWGEANLDQSITIADLWPGFVKTYLTKDVNDDCGFVAAINNDRLWAIGGGDGEPMWFVHYTGDDPEVLDMLRRK